LTISFSTIQAPSFKLACIFLVQIIYILTLLQLVGDTYGSSDITNTTESSPSNNLRTNSNTKIDTDLIRTCSTFRDIISEDAAYSCDYSMLYYKGRCEFYSDMRMNNKSDSINQTEIDFSFCSDPRVNEYIKEHGLTDAPRSPTLVP
jgi:hypothetical protein